jgi:hypothetical protein
MRFELRLFFAAFLLLLIIAVSCRSESIARAIDASGPGAPLVTPLKGRIVETI